MYNVSTGFQFNRPAMEENILFLKRIIYLIKAYNLVIITADAFIELILIKLINFAFISGFFMSLIPLRRLKEKRVY